MKSTNKVTEKMLYELLDSIGLNKVEGTVNKFYCQESEKEIELWLKNATLKGVLQFVKDHYYEIGNYYGKRIGERNKIEEIKTILEIK